jgi:hypothetical protein
MGNFRKLYFQRRTGPPLRYRCHDVYSTRSIAQVFPHGRACVEAAGTCVELASVCEGAPVALA